MFSLFLSCVCVGFAPRSPARRREFVGAEVSRLPAAAARDCRIIMADAALVSLLESVSLSHLSTPLTGKSLSVLQSELAEKGRPAFLSDLKAIGVDKLPERQKLATTIAKAARGALPWPRPQPSHRYQRRWQRPLPQRNLSKVTRSLRQRRASRVRLGSKGWRRCRAVAAAPVERAMRTAVLRVHWLPPQ